MSGSNAIATGATVCSVSGRLGQRRTGRLTAFCHGCSLKSSSTSATTRLLCSDLGKTKSWSCSAGAGHWRVCAAGEARRAPLVAGAVAENGGARGSTERNAYSGSKFSPVSIYHQRLCTLSCFRAATYGLVSSYNQSSGEIRKQSERRGRRNVSIVKAAQNDSNYDREEQRWIREEQRWVREEQRWLREEKRWEREEARWAEANYALQEEVRALKKELEEVRAQRRYRGEITDVSLRNLVAGMRNLLQSLGSEDLPLLESVEVLKQIPGTVPLSEGGSTTIVVGKAQPVVAPVSFLASPDKILKLVTPKRGRGNNPESNGATSKTNATTTGSNAPAATATTKRTLKSGMEGDDVKALHDALSELGFYSGEEDLEFSVFSDGTTRAVKTWQSTRGVPEDGKITHEFMAALLAEVAAKLPSTKEGAKSNSQPTAKAETAKAKQRSPEVKQPAPSEDFRKREIDRYERSDSQETGTGSSRRVYLLGENRWENPGRLQKGQEEEKRIKNGQTPKAKVGADMCFSCRGVGTMLCTDCEGTGDLNVEEQFLEWLDEGEAKCPYCEGSGAVQCDTCFGVGVKVETSA